MSVAPSHTLQATANVATRFIESRGNFKILLQLLENMVAREGAEAPTPAFSEPILTVIASTYTAVPDEFRQYSVDSLMQLRR
jgi:hypothetical protein